METATSIQFEQGIIKLPILEKQSTNAIAWQSWINFPLDFLTHFFSNGWFNHQLDNDLMSPVDAPPIFQKLHQRNEAHFAREGGTPTPKAPFERQPENWKGQKSAMEKEISIP